MNTSKFYSIAFSHHGSSVREIHFIPSFVFTLLWRTFFSACLDSRVIRADIITVAWTTRLYSRISLFIWTSINWRRRNRHAFTGVIDSHAVWHSFLYSFYIWTHVRSWENALSVHNFHTVWNSFLHSLNVWAHIYWRWRN